MDDTIERLRVRPGERVRLADYDPRDTGDWTKDEVVDERLAKDLERLTELQELLYVDARRALLVVLQGTDTSGKDGTIKHVMGAMNPQGVRVHSFKVPTEEERAHDFLWRVHHVCPPHRLVGIFNRSHYEDVLVPRVKRLVPEEVWRSRYDRINEFERLLSENGTVVVKFFLHISKEEQRERLQERVDRPDKRWKFRLGELEDRRLWDDYQAAYEDMLMACSTEHAPWYVVPADKKWYRNLVVANVLVDTLERMDLQPPEPEADLDGLVVE